MKTLVSALEFVSESCCCPKERPDNAHGEFLLLAVTWSSHTGVKYFHMEKFPKRGCWVGDVKSDTKEERTWWSAFPC